MYQSSRCDECHPPRSGPCPMASALASRGRRTRRRSNILALRYTPTVVPGISGRISGIATIIRRRSTHGSAGHFLVQEADACPRGGPKRAYRGQICYSGLESMLDRFKYLKATGMPARRWLRPSSGARIGPERRRGVRLRRGHGVPATLDCRTGTSLRRRQSAFHRPLSGLVCFVVADSRAPRCLSGGLVQLGSI